MDDGQHAWLQINDSEFLVLFAEFGETIDLRNAS